MLSLSSAKAGSRDAKGKSAFDDEAPPLGVVCEARRLVRDGGRRGVVGRDGTRRVWEELRWWLPGCWAGVVVAMLLFSR